MTGANTAAAHRSTTALERLVRQAQVDARVPALTAAVYRADRPLWTFQVGQSGTSVPLGPATQFRMGSITKTFTAVAVLQCRDDGLLDLDDPVSAHLEVGGHGDLTIRRLLSHTSGVGREPFGDVWDTLAAPSPEQFLADLARVERVLPANRRFHYSNVGLAVLGHLVGRLRGGSWFDVVHERILRPLGLDGISRQPGPQAAVGYLVDDYSDHVRPEPSTDVGGIAPAAQLWSTAADLARWAAFLADPGTMDPTGAVLAPATLDEMRWPHTTSDEALWSIGFGLGLILIPRPERVVHVGHDGAMPGFLAAAYGRRGAGSPQALGAAVLGSSGTAGATVELPHALLDSVVAEDPADIEPWVPGEPAPAAYRSILGLWWSEGTPFVFFWREGQLRARRQDDPPGRPPSVFEPLPAAGGPEELRTVSGRECGERLRLTRDPGSAAVVLMHWATYRVTRVQETFDGVAASQP